jgi:hypothetical protein
MAPIHQTSSSLSFQRIATVSPSSDASPSNRSPQGHNGLDEKNRKSPKAGTKRLRKWGPGMEEPNDQAQEEAKDGSRVGGGGLGGPLMVTRLLSLKEVAAGLGLGVEMAVLGSYDEENDEFC